MEDDGDTAQLIETPKGKVRSGHVEIQEGAKDDGHVQVQEEQEQMGCLSMYPTWLQRFAKPGWFLLAVSLFTIVQSMVNSGLFPVIISSIERRYGFNSTQTGFLLSSYDVVSAILVVIVTAYGHRAHRPLWLARGMTFLGAGCFLVTVPYWLAGTYVPVGSADTDVCLTSTGNSSCQNTQYGYLALLVLAQVVIATACSPLYPLGSTFIDDNVPPKDNGTYMGIFYSMGAVGPALGYVLGGLFLREWVDAGRSTTLTQNSVGWVGMWWAPFLVAGSLAVLLSIGLFTFPKQLPGMGWVLEERRRSKDRQRRRSKTGGVAEAAPTTETFLQSFKSIVLNKPYIFSQLGFTLEAVVIIGVGNFLPKIVQTQFRMTASNASFMSGGVIVLGAAGGILTGGLLSKNWTMRKTARNVLILGFLALLTIPCFLIHCDTISLAGLNAPYPASNVSTSLISTCNHACDCHASSYNPVCGASTTFFSACHAGCQSRVDDTTFTNCSCLPSRGDQAVLGSCDGACLQVIFFLLSLFLLMFITFMINVPGTIFCMRVVAEHQRSLALGIGSAIQRIGGAIPGPLIIGAILDGSCLLWETKCDGSNGACWEYNSARMSLDVFIASWVLKSLSTLSFFLAWYTYHPASAEADAPEAAKASDTLELGSDDATSPDDGDDGNHETSA